MWMWWGNVMVSPAQHIMLLVVIPCDVLYIMVEGLPFVPYVYPAYYAVAPYMYPIINNIGGCT